jgi:type II secretory pathway pseudopilin PulG|tara:strand:- start:265 stop:756 length:492 start_codon:yes stop_codon:yes gene_type:complete
MEEMKKTGFTLLELLLFITVIAILASVGVVAYNGYTGAAKVSATKTIHAQTVKSISAELRKCELDKTSIVYGNLNCSLLNLNSLALAASKNSNDRNPYDTYVKAVITKKNWDALDPSKTKLGYVILHSSSDKESLNITTFLKEFDDADSEKDLLTTSIKIKIK